LVEIPEIKSPYVKCMRTYEDNIKMVLKVIGLEFVDWILLDQDRNMITNRWSSVKCGEFLH
jgi:hypothetical protein